MRIPLYIGRNDSNAQIECEQKYIELNSFRLPIGIYTEKCTYYSEHTRLLDDSELEALANAELNKRREELAADCKILGENASFTADEDSGMLVATFSLLEDIGEETEIKINYSQDEK